MATDLRQTHFRFGKDDGTEATHTWWQLEDVNHSQLIAADWLFLLRFTEQEAGATAAANTDAQFQYNKNGAGWVDITTTSSVVRAVAVNAFTNGQACTKRLSGTGTFETTGAGCTEDGSSGGAPNDIAASGNSETEAGLQVVFADVANNDTIQLRFRSPDWAVTYTITPTLTVTTSLTSYQSLPATSIGVGVLSKANSFYRALASVAIASPVLLRISTFYKSLPSTAVGAAVLSAASLFSKALDAVAQGVSSLTKVATYSRLLASVATGITTLTKTATYYLNLAGTVIGVGVLATIKTFTKALTAVASGIATLATQFIAGGQIFYQSLPAIAQGIAGLSRKFYLTLTSTAAGLASLTKVVTFYRTLIATAIGTALLSTIRVFSKILAGVAKGIARITGFWEARHYTFTDIADPLAFIDISDPLEFGNIEDSIVFTEVWE